MKRLLALLLALMMLAGCTVDQPTEPPQTEPPTSKPTDPPAPVLYDGNSAVELQTGGAVRAYSLDDSCDGMLLLKDRVVLYYLGEQMSLKAYGGEELTFEAAASHHISIPVSGNGLQVTEQGIFYYDPTTHTMVILNDQLQEKHRVELPEQIQGIPVTNGSMDTAYYSTPEGIRAMDLNTGIAHMLRQQENNAGSIYAECFDGTLLLCAFDGKDGSVTTDFISTKTGLKVDSDDSLYWVESFGDRYFLKRSGTDGEMYLYGTMDVEENMEFVIPENSGEVLTALELDGILQIRQDENGFVMDFFRLDTGLRTASVTLEGLETLRNVVVDSRGYVWFMDADTLYRWEVAASPVTDETVYSTPWYSESNPNETGLSQCLADAAAIAQEYGVEIRIGKDAVHAPWENMSQEYRVEVLDTALEELEDVFAIFHEDMLAQTGTICDSGKFSISIVADTGAEQGQQIWVDGNAYIAIETGRTLRTELLRTIYRVMDTYVLSKTSLLDDWYAEKPAEDRAHLFVEALAADNGEYFEDWYTQSELRLLCRAIRRAYDLREYEADLPWEQYLDYPVY